MRIIRLRSIEYAERVGKPKEWRLDGLSLGQINLIVGTNASGKSRTINLIHNLARMFDPEVNLRPHHCGYDVVFDNGGVPIRYILRVEEAKVTKEELYVDGRTFLERGEDGEGLIYADAENKSVRFKPPENELAAVARRDSLQHPFLEPLCDWAKSVRHYTFGTTLGQQNVALFLPGFPEPNYRDPNQVVALFRQAQRRLGGTFVDQIKQDMRDLSYELEDVCLTNPEGFQLTGLGVPSELVAVGVKERGIGGVIDQTEMSQGMFRALSILIQLNYSQMFNRADCVLIDDIGEGLDFERSSLLIELLRRKAQRSSFQLVMTTNDRFVMNHVPLEEWSVLHRQDGNVLVRNYQNSREAFEEFRFTGLSNFSLLEMDFLNQATEKVAADE